MPDKIISDRLFLILDSIELINWRIKSIHTPFDFYNKDNALETLDAVSMRLQQIGENVKKINEIDALFF